MKKILTLSLVLIFAFSFAAGIFVTPAQAKHPIPCEYRCINHDWYLCCYYPFGEVCTVQPQMGFC